MDREAWRAVIYGVTKVRHNWATELTDLFGAVSHNFWNAVSQAIVFILPQINLTHNSHIVLFFLDCFLLLVY